jgi:2-amino-4-hydroxy-6-hydroxymethyldihydropteridine diphosphokinase
MVNAAYLSLGSNIGDRKGNLLTAIGQLAKLGYIAALSSFYETEPVEFTEQPWFLNCVIALETESSPQDLLAHSLAIEQSMGRHRREKKGPRNIDLDILLFGDLILESAELTIPHPSMHERRFVLEPLAQIAPEVRHPLLNQTILQLRDALASGQEVRRVERIQNLRDPTER